MLGTLYVVISSSKEEDYQKVKEELLEIYPDFSVSPYKESQMEKDAVEFFATCQITKEKAQEVLVETHLFILSKLSIMVMKLQQMFHLVMFSQQDIQLIVFL